MPTTLAELTTLRLGGPFRDYLRAGSDDELVDAIRTADARGDEVLLVGGGSNLVVGDAGVDGVVIAVGTADLDITGDVVTAGAGVNWDLLVRASMAAGLTGLETMSGIPGSAGATPVQNVGAYGAEIAQFLTGLTVYDRESGVVEDWTPERCGFGFRTSAFKHTDRYVVLRVRLRLRRSTTSEPVRYLELARRLGVEPGTRADPARVREEVLALRRSKGMVLDPADHDSWSVGSFFVNPLLDEVPPAAAECPLWEADGRRKLSAAWLIEHAGFHRGYGLGSGRGQVSVSTKHTLALTNRGTATTAELMALAAEIRDGVQRQFAIRLGPEAHLRNCTF